MMVALCSHGLCKKNACHVGFFSSARFYRRLEEFRLSQNMFRIPQIAAQHTLNTLLARDRYIIHDIQMVAIINAMTRIQCAPGCYLYWYLYR